jgi:hypothetical protein
MSTRNLPGGKVYKLYGERELVAEVQKRRLQYLGHVVRMEED